MWHGFGWHGWYGLYNLIPILVFIIFVCVICIILFAVVRGANTYSQNNNAPVLTVFATITGKRESVSQHHNTDHYHSHSTYYVTFQVESGDRLEFVVNGPDYGYLAQGDQGRLTFQGTRFLGFERAQISSGPTV